MQIWAWQRCLPLQPRRITPFTELPMFYPHGYRWSGPKSHTNVSNHNLESYRQQLAVMSEDKFVFFPYEDQNWYVRSRQTPWTSTTFLICFDTVVGYHPERVKRQFGRIQDIPNSDLLLVVGDDLEKFINLRRSGVMPKDWEAFFVVPIQFWDDRHNPQCVHLGSNRLVAGEPKISSDYLEWFEERTVKFVDNPAHRQNQPDDGFRSQGDRLRLVADRLGDINHMLNESLSRYREMSEISRDDMPELIENLEHIHIEINRSFELSCMNPSSIQPSQSIVYEDPGADGRPFGIVDRVGRGGGGKKPGGGRRRRRAYQQQPPPHHSPPPEFFENLEDYVRWYG